MKGPHDELHRLPSLLSPSSSSSSSSESFKLPSSSSSRSWPPMNNVMLSGQLLGKIRIGRKKQSTLSLRANLISAFTDLDRLRWSFVFTTMSPKSAPFVSTAPSLVSLRGRSTQVSPPLPRTQLPRAETRIILPLPIPQRCSRDTGHPSLS